MAGLQGGEGEGEVQPRFGGTLEDAPQVAAPAMRTPCNQSPLLHTAWLPACLVIIAHLVQSEVQPSRPAEQRCHFHHLDMS